MWASALLIDPLILWLSNREGHGFLGTVLKLPSEFLREAQTMATLADSFLADLAELSDNETDLMDEEDAEAANMAEDVDGDLADIETLNYDDLNSVSKLQKSQRYADLMQKVEDALQRDSDASNQGADQGMVLDDDPEYKLIVHCNSLSVDIENEIVIIHNFIQLESLVHHPIDYARVVKKIGNEMDVTLVDLEGLLPSAIIMVVSVTASTTSGKPLPEEILQKTIDACDPALSLDTAKKKVLDFVDSRMGYIAPNLSAILGSAVAAKLMGTAGGLAALAKMPAHNVRLLGAKLLACKSALAARVDSTGGYPSGNSGIACLWLYFTTYNLDDLLRSPSRDFLIGLPDNKEERSSEDNFKKVKVCELMGRGIGLYFGAAWAYGCASFSQKLFEISDASKGNFHIVYISSDANQKSFNDFFSKMNCVAVPFSDSASRLKLKLAFGIKKFPSFIVVDEHGMCSDGTELIWDYGPEAFPYTITRFAKDGIEVKMDIERKTLALYFYEELHGTVHSSLLRAYWQLEKKSDRLNQSEFEVLMLGEDVAHTGSHWFKLHEDSSNQVTEYKKIFAIEKVPSLIFIGPGGKLEIADGGYGVEILLKFGSRGFPFSKKHLHQLGLRNKEIRPQNMLEFLLCDEFTDDYLLDRKGAKRDVASYEGKYVLLYFSEKGCDTLLESLLQAYQTWEDDTSDMEIIYVSLDSDLKIFNEQLAQMPCFALPYWAKRRRDFLVSWFQVEKLPRVVAISEFGEIANWDDERRDALRKEETN
ncbi:hypothetical protein FNV43_RR26027 [Rhamnella rubrinervis]|uniref:Nop domain-containing protein n=1 Tax=Rhamnella rubrinervis TaxID=2594499 RepID=A0A8K0DM65_9ROSA|nr:hypothetical protein FNV43_RR26027 [Rhamnella rubrinervis]